MAIGVHAAGIRDLLGTPRLAAGTRQHGRFQLRGAAHARNITIAPGSILSPGHLMYVVITRLIRNMNAAIQRPLVGHNVTGHSFSPVLLSLCYLMTHARQETSLIHGSDREGLA